MVIINELFEEYAGSTKKLDTAQLLTTFNYNKQHLTTINNIKSSASKEQQLKRTALLNKGLRPSVEKQSVEMPDGIKSLKLDLFDNATNEEIIYDKRKFKLAMNIIKADGGKINVASALNSPIRNFKRGIINKNSKHYQLMAELIVRYKNQPEFKVSKFYQSANKQMITIQEWSVCIWQLEQGYNCILVMGTNILPIILSHTGITAKQKQAGVIATWNKVIKTHPIIWGNDLLKSKK